MPDTSEPSPGQPQSDGLDAAFAEARKLGWRVGIPVLIASLLPMVSGFALIGFAVAYQQGIREWFSSHGRLGLAGFAGAFALSTGLAMMPTYAMSFAAGVFFGFTDGAIGAMAAIVVGAAIGYLLGVVTTRERVMQVLQQNEKARIIRDALVERSPFRAAIIVTLLRLPPNSPFAIGNLVMSSVRVNFFSYLVGTVIGIMPRTLIVAYVGARAGDLAEWKTAGGWWTKFGAAAATVVILVFAFGLLSRWAKAALAAQLRASDAVSG